MTDQQTIDQHAYNNLIMQWQAAKQNLNHYKKLELELRKQIIDLTFLDKTEGSHKHELGNGYGLSTSFTFKRELASNAEVEEVMKELEPVVAHRLFNYKYSLNKKEYDELTDEEKLIVSKVITAKPNQASLKLTEPKET